MSFMGLLDWVRTRGTSHETYAVDPAVRAHSYGAGLPEEKVAKLVTPTTYFPYATTKAYRELWISTAMNCKKSVEDTSIRTHWLILDPMPIICWLTPTKSIGPLQLAIHVTQHRRAGEQKSHWDKTNKENYNLKLCMSCLTCPCATFARQHGGFLSREWLAAKGLLI